MASDSIAFPGWTLPYFHYPNGKTREYTELRQYVTSKYGVVATVVVVSILSLIPLKNYLLIRGFSLSNKFPVLRSINSKLNKYIYVSDDLHSKRTAFRRLQSTLARFVKSFLFKVLLHSTTIVQVAFWSALLGSLSFAEIYHGDLIFLAKRLGRLSAACLPPVLFLTLRPSPLPNTLYLSLLPIHKWLSRIIVLQAIVHTILYLGFFQYNSTWPKAWKAENNYGWVALLGFVVIVITSLSKMRNRWYKTFFFNHYVWTWIIVICLQFHVRPVKFTYYSIANLLILTGQIAYRLWLTSLTPTKLDFKVLDISPNLSIVEFPNNLIKRRAVNPGAHIRLTNFHRSSILTNIYKQLIPNYHPYTLVSLPQDNYQKLIIRRSNFKIENNQKYLIYGSYDPHLLFISSKNRSNAKFSISKLAINAKRILIVIGGSAISFALPLLRVMNYHGIPVKIIWVIRDFRDILVLKHFDGFVHGEDFEIFITGDAVELRDHEKKLKGALSYGSLISTSSKLTTNIDNILDLETSESSPLLPATEYDHLDDNASLNFENETENVEISVDEEVIAESDDEACAIQENSTRDDRESLNSEESDDDQQEVSQFLGETLSRTPSQKTFTSMNEQFVCSANPLSSETTKNWVQQFQETVKSLNLEHKVYKGRPKLNYKYYNWCVNEGFTQCSGPVQDENHNYICCRDLPKNRVRQDDIDCEKIWVVAAGPQALVRNVKVWANEYGLKFHEEAFYV